MAIPASQAKRIEESRKKFDTVKEEFLLKPITPTKRQEIIHRNALLLAVKKTKDAVVDIYNKSATLNIAKDLINDLYKKMPWWDELNSSANTLVGGMDSWHRGAFFETTSTVTGINVAGFVSEQGLGDLIESMVEVNVDQITSLQESSRKRVIDLVNNSLTGQESKSPTLSSAITEAFNGVTSNQARFIARDQTQRAVNGLNRFRQEHSGIKKYKWVTSKDNRVRDTHAHMDGLEVEWASGKIVRTPLSIKRGLAGKNVKNVANGHVGQDYNCRCSASPILEI